MVKPLTRSLSAQSYLAISPSKAGSLLARSASMYFVLIRHGAVLRHAQAAPVTGLLQEPPETDLDPLPYHRRNLLVLQRCVDARGWASILEGSLVGELLHLRERHLLVYRSDPSALFRGAADPAALPRPLSHGHALRPIRVLSRSDAVLRCPSG